MIGPNTHFDFSKMRIADHTRVHSGIGQSALEKFQQPVGEVKIERMNEQQVEKFI
jgi:hypothetical protein